MRIIVAFVACLAFAGLNVAQGQDFRVETDVYEGERPQPVLQNLTIFFQGAVYEFPLNDNSRATMYDVSHGRIVMFDVNRQVKTTINPNQLQQFCAKWQAKVHATQPEELMAKIDPDFVVEYDDSQSSVVLSSPHIIYEVTGAAPKFPAAARQYGEFAEWAARLSWYPAPNKSLPPFAQVKRCQAVAEKGLVPEAVKLIRFVKRGGKPEVIRSRHLFNWILSGKDEDRVIQVGNYLTSFKEVPLAAF